MRQNSEREEKERERKLNRFSYDMTFKKLNGIGTDRTVEKE
jgi:hypothetical protein